MMEMELDSPCIKFKAPHDSSWNEKRMTLRGTMLSISSLGISNLPRTVSKQNYNIKDAKLLNNVYLKSGLKKDWHIFELTTIENHRVQAATRDLVEAERWVSACNRKPGIHPLKDVSKPKNRRINLHVVPQKLSSMNSGRSWIEQLSRGGEKIRTFLRKKRSKHEAKARSRTFSTPVLSSPRKRDQTMFLKESGNEKVKAGSRNSREWKIKTMGVRDFPGNNDFQKDKTNLKKEVFHPLPRGKMSPASEAKSFEMDKKHINSSLPTEIRAQCRPKGKSNDILQDYISDPMNKFNACVRPKVSETTKSNVPLNQHKGVSTNLMASRRRQRLPTNSEGLDVLGSCIRKNKQMPFPNLTETVASDSGLSKSASNDDVVDDVKKLGDSRVTLLSLSLDRSSNENKTQSSESTTPPRESSYRGSNVTVRTPKNTPQSTMNGVSDYSRSSSSTPSRSLLRLLHSAHGWSLDSIRERPVRNHLRMTVEDAGWSLELPMVVRNSAPLSEEDIQKIRNDFIKKNKEKVADNRDRLASTVRISKDQNRKYAVSLRKSRSLPKLKTYFAKTGARAARNESGSSKIKEINFEMANRKSTTMDRKDAESKNKKDSERARLPEFRRKSQRSQSFSSSWDFLAMSLQAYLKNPWHRQKLKEYLEAQYAIESINFLEAVEAYSHMNGYKERKASALIIIGEFLAEKSPQQLNVSDKLLNSLLQDATKGHFQTDLFEKIEQDVKSLLERDSFMRYKLAHLATATTQSKSPDDLSVRMAMRLNRSRRSYAVIALADDKEELLELKKDFWSDGIVRPRWCKLHRIPNTFYGEQLTSWMLQSQRAPTRADAIVLGQRLMDAGLFQHISGNTSHSNEFTSSDLYAFPSLVSKYSAKRLLRNYTCVYGVILVKGHVRYSKFFVILPKGKKRLHFYHTSMDSGDLFYLPLQGGTASVSESRSSQTRPNELSWDKSRTEDNKHGSKITFPKFNVDGNRLGRKNSKLRVASEFSVFENNGTKNNSRATSLGSWNVNPNESHRMLKSELGINQEAKNVGNFNENNVSRLRAVTDSWVQINSRRTWRSGDNSTEVEQIVSRKQSAKAANGEEFRMTYLTLQTAGMKRTVIMRFESDKRLLRWSQGLKEEGVSFAPRTTGFANVQQ